MNVLTDVIPARYRRYVYAVLALAAIILGAWQATDGDWMQTVVYVLGALGFGTATANTHPEQEHDDSLRA